MDERTIPLFPLPSVLFPKMLLPLHIFEERYKEMIDRCLTDRGEFGILANDDLESGSVGCTALVHRVIRRYDDGRMDLLAVGKNRFRLLEVMEERPYLEGRVEYFEDLPDAGVTRARIERMLRLYRSFISRLGLEQQQKRDLDEIVSDIEIERDLSYVIGQTIGLDAEAQRRLLAQTDPAGRVLYLLNELRRQDQVHDLARQLFEKEDFDPQVN
ncbi:hypothetical protein GF324_09365 [bacterium]|nr:hypothetical protein [bacterium]